MSYKHEEYMCPECKYCISLQDIVDDHEDEIIDMLESTIEDRAEELMRKWKEEDYKHVQYVFDNVIKLSTKHKYFLNGEAINYIEELTKIIEDSKTL